MPRIRPAWPSFPLLHLRESTLCIIQEVKILVESVGKMSEAQVDGGRKDLSLIIISEVGLGHVPGVDE